jgi:hypothetical protein
MQPTGGPECQSPVDCDVCHEQGGDFFEGELCGNFDCPVPPSSSCCVAGQCQNGINSETCAFLNGVFRNEPDCPDTECVVAGGGCLIGAATGCGSASEGFWFSAVSPTPRATNPPCAGGRTHESLKTCGLTHIQSTKGFLRIVHNLAQNNSGAKISARCPNYGGGNPFATECSPSQCCCSEVHISPCVNCTGRPDAAPTVRPAEPTGQFICDVYPFKYRCQQTEDIDGLQRCGLLDEPLDIFSADINNAEAAEQFIPKVFYGHEDPLACVGLELGPEASQWDCESLGPCDLPVYSPFVPIGDILDAGDEQPNCALSPDDFFTYSSRRACRCSGSQQDCAYTKMNVRPEDISTGSYCNAISFSDVLGATSLNLASDVFTEPMGFYNAGGPNPYQSGGNIVMGVPQSNCFRIATQNKDSLPKPSRLPDGTLRRCADYYLDKTLSELSGTFQEPALEYAVKFADYADKNWNEGGGTDGDNRPLYEYVDFQTKTPGFENLWLNRKYPGANNIRFFGIDPGTARDAGGASSRFNSGGFSGGQLSGNFVGTMVINFGSSAEFRAFDNDMGHEDLYLKFLDTEAPSGLEGCTFYARPSFNYRWNGAVHSEERDGWIGDVVNENYAAGLVPRSDNLTENIYGYAEFSTTNPLNDDGTCMQGTPDEDGKCPSLWQQTGKVYEIGTPSSSAGGCPLLPSATPVITTGSGSGIVNRFVGCGPLEFRDRESFTMQIVPAGSNGTRVREEGLPDIGEAIWMMMIQYYGARASLN